jgi:SAM-dependent methyltransferase
MASGKQLRRLWKSKRRTPAAPAKVPATRLFPAEATIAMPEPSLRRMVGPPGVFRDVALTTMGRLNMAGLRPDHDVLDVGCGVGRTARYLCDYLDEGARYEGFDIVEPLITWCQTQITPLFPNFQFQLVPLFNSAYRPDESLPSASEMKFPYPDDSFDFSFAHSLFTHLTLEASSNYLSEVHRVLRHRGVSYTTWLLFEEDPSTSVTPLIAHMRLDPSGNFALYDPDIPDDAIGYRESFVRKMFAESGLDIVEPVHPGFSKLQDVVVAVKR